MRRRRSVNRSPVVRERGHFPKLLKYSDISGIGSHRLLQKKRGLAFFPQAGTLFFTNLPITVPMK